MWCLSLCIFVHKTNIVACQNGFILNIILIIKWKMPQLKKLFCCERIILENGELNGGLLVYNGVIEKVLTKPECKKLVAEEKLMKVIDVGSYVLLAGVVDSHVHVNEPGRTQWEGFLTATAAAAAGGITTIVDMPLNSIPPTTTVENLKSKATAAQKNIYIDVGFWGGVIPSNQNDLIPLIESGVVGFKCFLCPSGVDEFPNVTEKDLDLALEKLSNTDSVLAFHAELEEHCNKEVTTEPEAYQTYLKTRPPQMEINALKLIEKMVQKYNVRMHIVHLSAASGVNIVQSMRQHRETSGLSPRSVTAETCHHYLTLTAEEVPDKHTEFKCAPPVRNKDNRELLWEHLRKGDLDLVVSDHSPCVAELKCGNFLEAWGGISSVQFGLSLFWTEACKRGFKLQDVTRLLSYAPAQLCHLQDRKGALKPGLDADFIIFDPDAFFYIKKDDIRHKNKLTPYLGMTLKGVVIQTYLRGQLIYENGQVLEKPQGQLLLTSHFIQTVR